MHSLVGMPSLFFRSVFRYAMTMAIAMLVADIAFADAMCGNEERAYMEKLINGLQPHASQVTSRGKFSAKKEYGNGSMAIRISFSENGKQLFTYRTAESGGAQWAGIGARPGSTKSGQPAFTFYFDQGNMGACEANVLIKDGMFVFTPIRFVR